MKIKIDNAAAGRAAKVEIRARVLAAVTPARAVVFDAFAGAGVMFEAVWRQAADYVGCDDRWHDDARCCFVADNRRVMRAVDLSRFTVFDFDAYGSPWEQALILAARRPLAAGERLGLVITEGTWLSTKGGVMPKTLRQATGVASVVVGNNVRARGMHGAMHDELIARALRTVVARLRGRIVQQWRAVGTTGARMRYLGVVVEGVPVAVKTTRRPRAGAAR